MSHFELSSRIGKEFVFYIMYYTLILRTKPLLLTIHEISALHLEVNFNLVKTKYFNLRSVDIQTHLFARF